MRAFIDTSSMMKKYIDEMGADDFDHFLLSVTQIVVSPTYRLEAHAAIESKFRSKRFSIEVLKNLKKEINKDIIHYEQINFGQELYERAVNLIGIYPIATLDSIQLASASIADVDIFVTSDKQLYKFAQQELKKVELI